MSVNFNIDLLSSKRKCPGKHLGLLANCLEGWIRECVVYRRSGTYAFELYDLFRILYREHLQERRVDEAEDCSNSANSERKNHDRGHRKYARPPQLSHCIA